HSWGHLFQVSQPIPPRTPSVTQHSALPLLPLRLRGEVVSPYGSGFTRVPSKSPAVFPKGIPPSRHSPRGGVPMRLLLLATLALYPFAEKIEAVYTFPLPPDSAVDDMTIHIGDRTIRGLIKPRDEARKIYEEA